MSVETRLSEKAEGSTARSSPLWLPSLQSESGVSRLPVPWAVLLAGGEGTRLQSLTRKIAGDSRPKQFCGVLGGRSLLR